MARSPDRKAHPLPIKIPTWAPLHLTFRHAALPDLPTIHSPIISNILRRKSYEGSAGPSGHSVQSLAWMGDAVLYLASTKACLKAGLRDGGSRCQQLGQIRSGLTTNRTFSYLTLSYRIHEILGHSQSLQFLPQKRYADYFEAYIGAAWVSASETKDPEHIREIELFLSQLYKPKAWPALESLMNGSKGFLTAVRLDQDLLDDGADDDDDIAVFDVPPSKISQVKNGFISAPVHGKGKGKKAMKSQTRASKLADITERNRQNVIASRINSAKAPKAVSRQQAAQITPHRPREVSYWSARRRQIEEWSAARRRPSSGSVHRSSRPTIDARPAAPCTPVRSKDTIPRSLSQRPPPSTIKVYRLAADNVGEEEIDMDICEDSDWEDVKPVAGPSTSTTRLAGHRRQDGSGTSLAPIVID